MDSQELFSFGLIDPAAAFLQLTAQWRRRLLVNNMLDFFLMQSFHTNFNLFILFIFDE